MRVPTLRGSSVHDEQKSRYSFDIGVQLFHALEFLSKALHLECSCTSSICTDATSQLCRALLHLIYAVVLQISQLPLDRCSSGCTLSMQVADEQQNCDEHLMWCSNCKVRQPEGGLGKCKRQNSKKTEKSCLRVRCTTSQPTDACCAPRQRMVAPDTVDAGSAHANEADDIRDSNATRGMGGADSAQKGHAASYQASQVTTASLYRALLAA